MNPALLALLRRHREALGAAAVAVLGLWVAAQGGLILIDARDDGSGAASVVAGNGLRGMRERLHQHGGKMTIGSKPGTGFQLCLQLPVDSNEAAALEPVPTPPDGVTA